MSDALGIIVNTASGSNGSTLSIIDYGTFSGDRGNGSNFGNVTLRSQATGASNSKNGWNEGYTYAELTIGEFLFAIVKLDSGVGNTATVTSYAGGLGIGFPNTSVNCPLLVQSSTTYYVFSKYTVDFTDTTIRSSTRYGSSDAAAGNWYVFG